ncbi:hypothetical protein BB560_006263 [Smittium megazygosporum]|nr:hypothetical protein BB560_006263 [Smittium megazygosporum]
MGEYGSTKDVKSFGEYYNVSEDAYAKEITEASKTSPVVVHLYERTPECDIVSEILKEMANEHKQTKFVGVVASRSIKNYPLRNVPTLLLYKDGDLVDQKVGFGSIAKFGESMQDVKARLEGYFLKNKIIEK